MGEFEDRRIWLNSDAEALQRKRIEREMEEVLREQGKRAWLSEKHWRDGPPVRSRIAELEKGERHASDCAVHNEPASPNGPCNCGITEKGE